VVAVDILTIRVEAGPPRALLLEGEIDLATAGQLRDALLEAVASDSTPVVVDMAGVTFVDASGIRTVLEVAQAMNGRGPLTIMHAPLMQRLLDLVGLHDVPSVVIRDEA
jgi:anti-sigma B factor antagonist